MYYFVCSSEACVKQAFRILRAASDGEHVLDDGEEGVIALCKRSEHSACFLASMRIDRAVKHLAFAVDLVFLAIFSTGAG
jgi:hypothetical protein